MRNFRIFFFVVFLGVLLSYQNCSPVNFSVLPAAPSGNSITGPNIAVQDFKPALAVRGISCMVCHTQIHSNIITDFGYGDPQFFVNQYAGTIYGSSSTINDASPLSLPWYGNYYGTWQLANQLEGTVYVPKVNLSDSRLLTSIGQSSSLSLGSLISMDLGSNFYGGAPYTGTGPLISMVTPAAGNSPVQEMSQIYIGAPTADQILALAPSLSASTPGWLAVGNNSSVSGLVVQAGNGGSYVTNSGSVLNCIGDVVISGTLLLNNVTISTDNGGCRLMVSQSVFIQGQILYSDLSGTANLQLSSARGIILGFDVSHLTTRFGSWYPDAQPLTRGSGTNTQKNALILAEASVVGSSIFDSTDSTNCPTSMVTYTGYNGGGSQTVLTQCSINYTRLLLNAPNVESRYIGLVSGVTIAEIALFAPGALDFNYDSTFDSVSILPLLGTAVLSVSP